MKSWNQIRFSEFSFIPSQNKLLLCVFKWAEGLLKGTQRHSKSAHPHQYCTIVFCCFNIGNVYKNRKLEEKGWKFPFPQFLDFPESAPKWPNFATSLVEDSLHVCWDIPPHSLTHHFNVLLSGTHRLIAEWCRQLLFLFVFFSVTV